MVEEQTSTVSCDVLGKSWRPQPYCGLCEPAHLQRLIKVKHLLPSHAQGYASILHKEKQGFILKNFYIHGYNRQPPYEKWKDRWTGRWMEGKILYVWVFVWAICRVWLMMDLRPANTGSVKNKNMDSLWQIQLALVKSLCLKQLSCHVRELFHIGKGQKYKAHRVNRATLFFTVTSNNKPDHMMLGESCD